MPAQMSSLGHHKHAALYRRWLLRCARKRDRNRVGRARVKQQQAAVGGVHGSDICHLCYHCLCENNDTLYSTNDGVIITPPKVFSSGDLHMHYPLSSSLALEDINLGVTGTRPADGDVLQCFFLHVSSELVALIPPL